MTGKKVCFRNSLKIYARRKGKKPSPPPPDYQMTCPHLQPTCSPHPNWICSVTFERDHWGWLIKAEACDRGMIVTQSSDWNMSRVAKWIRMLGVPYSIPHLSIIWTRPTPLCVCVCVCVSVCVLSLVTSRISFTINSYNYKYIILVWYIYDIIYIR